MDGDDGGAASLLCCRISHSVQGWDNVETRNPLCLVAASEYRATRELVESSWMATMGGAAWLLCCRMSHYLQSWDNGWTRNPLCLVAASEHRATRELAQSSGMANMWHILQLFAELQVEAEPGLTLPTLLDSY